MHVEIKLNPDLDVWYIEGDSSYYWWDDKHEGVKKVSPKKVRIVKRKNRPT